MLEMMIKTMIAIVSMMRHFVKAKSAKQTAILKSFKTL